MSRKPEYDREKLIGLARDVFWERGWAGTSMKDLERVLGLQPGSFYAAFGSKAALYELSLERYVQEGQASLAALAAEFGALGALKRHPMNMVDKTNGAAKACMLAKTVLELQSLNNDLAGLASASLSKVQGTLTALFAQAQTDGEIAKHHDPALLARRYQSDLLGLRVSAERSDVDATAIAAEIAADLDRLA